VTLIRQWDPKKPAPLSPLARVILTAGDIALEYVAINPGLFGVGGNGEKLIGAFAQNLAELLPDDGEFGDNQHFGQRLLGIFLRAGFETIQQNPAWILPEKHIQKMIAASVGPIIDAMPTSITEQIKYREVVDALMGPAASAALQTVADNPAAFWGDDFGASTAVGALTQALLAQAAKIGLRQSFTQEGLIQLYKALLGVAATKPNLFAAADGTPRMDLAADLLARFAEGLIAAPPPFSGKVGVELAAAALDTMGRYAYRFADPTRPWEKAAAAMAAQTMAGLAKALAAGPAGNALFSTDQLIELGRILLAQIGATPEMVTGREEVLSQLVAAVAQAMAADTKLLLDGDDWLEIVRVMAEEAARNPGRLFKLDPGDAAQAAAADIVRTVLEGAATAIEDHRSGGATVLFGRTLRAAIILSLRLFSGNPRVAEQALPVLKVKIDELNALVATHADRFGSTQWLSLFQLLLDTVIRGEDPPKLTADNALALLKRSL
jgi:hypothetical protein